MRRVELTSIEGVRWVPDAETGSGVLTIAGSSGRIDDARAHVFARHGVLAESVRWFGGAGQHPALWEIPLETFLRRIENLRRDCDRVWMVGSSFGSEAALLCGALCPQISGVVAFAPSDVVWAGNDGGRETSHWSLGGEPVPFVPIDRQAREVATASRFRPIYERSRRTFTDRVEAATIPVERIAEVILVAGADDRVWPSIASTERVSQRRTRHGRETTVVTSHDAGHRSILPGEPAITVGVAMDRGGTESADRELGARAWEVISMALELTARSADTPSN
ncbi:acyl-CoA thioester hydrolase/BAAT C-terminal domain-containing protein [Microbacterium sp. NE2HP2]|uniref:acyl-CoA thioester hydrolase/BAAT C-terminal domain-containing protein n=1 Tax=Microbacterium plantarum TaxID=1816425 RepID=UPI002365E486|nr:acyl-CoA thioester hydrolase/BAAT C-terminal domain-containing protein [Microbacterium plantarum]MDD7944078.1 acyl-CoA thioester hydrolase/BAAT C-terminal domain-containing protein [Microbacterium plantarum]